MKNAAKTVKPKVFSEEYMIAFETWYPHFLEGGYTAKQAKKLAQQQAKVSSK